MENKKKNKKAHLSSHFVNAEAAPTEKSLVKMPSISNKFATTSRKLNEISSSNEESQFLKGFFVKKNFSIQNSQEKPLKTEISREFLTKTDSIWSEKNMKLWSLSLEKSEKHVNFKRLEALHTENLLKTLEKTFNFKRFTTLLENIFNKILSKISFFSEIDKEITMNINGLEEILLGFFKEFSTIYENFNKKMVENNEKINNLMKIIEEQKKRFSNEINDYFISLNTSTEQQYKKIHNKASLNELYANLENQKLEKEIEILRNSLKVYEKSHNVDEVLREFNQYREQNEKKLEDFNVTVRKKDLYIFQISGQLNVLKTNNAKLEKEVAQKSDTIKRLLNKNEDLETQIKIQSSLSFRYKETALMQKEDYDALLNENSRKNKHIHFLESKMKEIKRKMGYNMELLSSLKEDEFEGDNNLLKQIATFMTTKFVKNLQKNTTEQEKNKDAEVFSEDFQLNSLQYYKPSFFSFVKNEGSFKNDAVAALNFLQRNKEFKISPMFLATIRAIFDSKYNEFMISEDFRQISKFPDFVYSWLSTFFVSSASRTIKLLDHEKTSDIDTLREDFLLTLSNPLVGKLWECINFKEFLEEKSSNDELFFYLHCRFLLNKGPQLDSDGATFNYIHYVKNEHALFIVDLIMGNHDENTRNFIKQKLSEKTRFKKTALLIDSAFVLRVLLEYYRLERRQKFKLIRNLFISLPISQKSKKKLAINSFKVFRILLEKIHNNCCELDKAELFRECWQIGLGEITPEVFFTVLTETNFFVFSLKLKSFLNVPLTNNLVNQDDYLNVSQALIYKLNEPHNQDFLKETERILEENGNEKMVFLWEKAKKNFSDNFKFIDFAALCGKIPDLNFINLIIIVLKSVNLKNFNFHLKNENYCEFNEVVGDCEVYEKVLSILNKNINENRIKEFEKNKKVKKIQDFVKRKIRKWYVLINKLLKKKK